MVCLTFAEVVAYVDGNRSLQNHVEGCPFCQRNITEVDNVKWRITHEEEYREKMSALG